MENLIDEIIHVTKIREKSDILRYIYLINMLIFELVVRANKVGIDLRDIGIADENFSVQDISSTSMIDINYASIPHFTIKESANNLFTHFKGRESEFVLMSFFEKLLKY